MLLPILQDLAEISLCLCPTPMRVHDPHASAIEIFGGTMLPAESPSMALRTLYPKQNASRREPFGQVFCTE